jgi:molybdopterin-guanine dinucleotide biosynthesis protein B
MSSKMIGIAGRPGSDKSSLVVDLVGELSRRGLTVSTMIGVDDPAAIDQPGKDSFRHRDAGAEEVMVTSAQRWALIHGGGVENHETLAQMTPVDLVITEDMGGDSYPLIEVYRVATEMPPLGRDDPAIVAVVSDGPLDGLKKPVIDLDDLPAVADFIVAHMDLA